MYTPTNAVIYTTGPVLHISIETISGKFFTLEVEASDSIENLKAMIKDQECIEPDLQRLLFSGKQLADERTLSEYCIENEDTVTLGELICHYRCAVLCLNGMTYTWCHCSAVVPLAVKIETLIGEVVTVTIDACDTVEKVAEIVEQDIQLPAGCHRLVFGENVLDRKRTLVDVNVHEGDTLQLLQCPGNNSHMHAIFFQQIFRCSFQFGIFSVSFVPNLHRSVCCGTRQHPGDPT